MPVGEDSRVAGRVVSWTFRPPLPGTYTIAGISDAGVGAMVYLEGGGAFLNPSRLSSDESRLSARASSSALLRI